MFQDKKLLIFDCDGVLIDSHDANIAYFNHSLQSAGYPPIPEEHNAKIVYMSIQQLLTEFIEDPFERKRVLKISRTVPYDPFLPGLKPHADFERLFSPLSKKYNLAIASNRGVSLKKVIEFFHLDRYFSFYVSTLEAQSKPSPEMLLKCLDHFKTPEVEAVYFGDAVSDYEAARNANIDYVWVGNRKEQPNIPSIAALSEC